MHIQKPYIFFLGGHDLEMQEIKRILEVCGYEKGINYFDAGLKWNNAFWSAYKDIIDSIIQTEGDNKPTIVGIELFDDDKLSMAEEWKLLDHHNENCEQPASLAQLIKLLRFEPINAEEEREIELIIANDQDAIAGLRLAGATNHEITRIRRAEAKIINVSNETKEIFAKEEHEKNDRKENNVRVVKTLANTFYGLTDSFPDSNIIIYNNSSLQFSGLEAKRKVLTYFKSIPGLKYYYGGKHIGYIGTISLPTGVSLEDLVTGILNQHTLNVQSYHTFMFPFRWDYVKSIEELDVSFQVEKISLEKRLDFKKIIQQLTDKSNPNKFGNWETKQFDITKEKDLGMKYNEYMYFHPFVHQCIYDLPDDDNSEEELVKYFELKEGNSGSFEIKTLKSEYTLDLYGISLHVFKNGIGVLTFQLENNKYSDVDSIININDFGRRIYPQFINTSESNLAFIYKTQEAFLPLLVTLNLTQKDNSIHTIREDFTEFNCRDNLSRDALIRLPAYITALLPKNFVTAPKQIKENTFFIRPSIDDRMFTVCAVGNTLLAQEICYWNDKRKQYNYESSETWNRLIFSDSGWCTTQSKHLLKKLNNLHTYDRWANGHTLYGISRETFLLLTTDFNKEDFSYKVLSFHMRYMYYHVAILCLVQRAGMLRFSGEVGAIASLDKQKSSKQKKKSSKQKKKSKIKVADSITYLHMAYIEFVNKMFFREVTPQIQGIEIYDKMHEIMRMDEDIKELDKEIQELYEYVMITQQTEEAKQSRYLSTIATYMLPATLVFGILGANIYNRDLIFSRTVDFNALAWIIVGICLSILISLVLFKIYKLKK